jgi:hypothetical protein
MSRSRITTLIPYTNKQLEELDYIYLGVDETGKYVYSVPETVTKLIELKNFLSDGNVYLPDSELNEELLSFLSIFDNPTQYEDEISPISFSDLKQFIIDFDKLWSMDEVPDQFFENLAYLLHYEFDDRYVTVSDAREVLKNLIFDYKRKGTMRSYRAIAILLGIKIWVYNNVHKVVVPSVQGQLSGYSKDQQKTYTGRTKELLPANIYHHEGYIQDNRNIHEGVIDIVFTFTKYYERLKELIDDIIVAGYFPRFTEKSKEEIDCSLHSLPKSNIIEMMDASINIFDVDFRNLAINFTETGSKYSFEPRGGEIMFGSITD